MSLTEELQMALGDSLNTSIRKEGVKERDRRASVALELAAIQKSVVSKFQELESGLRTRAVAKPVLEFNVAQTDMRVTVAGVPEFRAKFDLGKQNWAIIHDGASDHIVYQRMLRVWVLESDPNNGQFDWERHFTDLAIKFAMGVKRA